jgi:hypothetical protein
MVGKKVSVSVPCSCPLRGNCLSPAAGAAKVALATTMTSSRATAVDTSNFFMVSPILVIIFSETRIGLDGYNVAESFFQVVTLGVTKSVTI